MPITHTPHALADDFASEALKISAIKQSDAHFAKLVDDYDAINLQVYRSEARLDLMSEEDEEQLRRARAALKDQIWARIK